MLQDAGIGNRRLPLDPAGRLIMRIVVSTHGRWWQDDVLMGRQTEPDPPSDGSGSREDEKFTINHPKFAWRPWNWRMLGD
jgi:hypothetical protein